VCGVTIGRYAFVAAGAVVTRDIPDYGYVRGVPSKQVGWMSRHGHVLDFSQSKSAVCPESNLQYQLDEDNLSAPTVRCVEIDEEQSLDASLRVGSKPYNSFRHD
jgi:UDP-2-acetamido-3-amino-2,3-dideoxy-glucuronate N-acetyltransferase